jgi:hypothetical protein
VIESGVGVVIGVPELILVPFAFFGLVWKVVVELLDPR